MAEPPYTPERLAERRVRGPAHFRQCDITAAIRSVERAGKKVDRVTICGDTITLITSDRAPEPVVEVNEWDVEPG